MPSLENNTSEYLLAKWEESYKKGLLSLWILLALHERPSYPYELNDAIKQISTGSLSAENNSIYRALNRFDNCGIVESELRSSETGPSRRYYMLTPLGLELLARFIVRNIRVFTDPEIEKRLDAVLSDVEIDYKEAV
jgi:DNA-binding PadR family transcriptional regulator